MNALKNAVRRLFRGSADEYLIIRTGRNEGREVVERDLDAAPDPELWEIENDHLDPGTYRCQAMRGGEFAEVAWTVTVGNPSEAREIESLREELAGLRHEIERDDGGDVMEQVPTATLQAVLAGQLGVQEARAVAELHRSFEGHRPPERSSLAESVEDPSDVKEIGGRAVLDLLDDPEKLKQFSEAAGSAMGQAAVGAVQGAQQPAQPAQPAQPSEAGGQLDLGADEAAATDGGQPEQEKSAAQRALESARDEDEAGDVDGDETADDEGGDRDD